MHGDVRVLDIEQHPHAISPEEPHFTPFLRGEGFGHPADVVEFHLAQPLDSRDSSRPQPIQLVLGVRGHDHCEWVPIHNLTLNTTREGWRLHDSRRVRRAHNPVLGAVAGFSIMRPIDVVTNSPNVVRRWVSLNGGTSTC